MEKGAKPTYRRGGCSRWRLRLIVEREREIEAFNPVEYWSIEAEFLPEGGKQSFIAKLAKIDDEDPVLGKGRAVRSAPGGIETGGLCISKIKRGERQRNPAAPFITSTLQQEASRKLGYTARRTMALAQQLYEGIDIGQGGAVGLITYMRTDSTNISELAQDETPPIHPGALWREIPARDRAEI